MASLILRVSPKSSPVTISFFLSVGALFTASPYRARASRFTASPYSLRLRAIALALRVLEAARYRACDPRRPLGLGNDRSPTLGRPQFSVCELKFISAPYNVALGFVNLL